MAIDSIALPGGALPSLRRGVRPVEGEDLAHEGRDLRRLHADTAWRLPIPAVFVVAPDAQIVFAFSDVDSARWPDPEELIASLDALRDAHARA